MPIWGDIKDFHVGKEKTGLNEAHLTLSNRGALQLSDDAFHALADTMPQIVWSTLPNGDHDYYNARWYQFTGVPRGSTDGDGWADMFHPEDTEEAQKRWKHSLETGEPYEVEYRLRYRTGDYRWVLGRALPILDNEQVIQRWIGTCTDIHDAKLMANHNEILSHELSHRIKNIFAIITSLIGITGRTNESFRETAEELRQRIDALGRAHNYVKPFKSDHSSSDDSVSLHKLLAEIFSPYPAYSDGKLIISGVDVSLNDKVITPIALIFHELVTNCMKYGSLTDQEGMVTLIIETQGEDIFFKWQESGGPEIISAPEHSGFGSKLLELSINQQLRGTIDRRWKNSGLEVEMQVKSFNLSDN